MENNFVWDEDKLKKLRKLWDAGLPITKIGKELVYQEMQLQEKHIEWDCQKKFPISKSGEPRKNQESKNLENSRALPLKITLRDVEWSEIGVVGLLVIQNYLDFLFVALQ